MAAGLSVRHLDKLLIGTFQSALLYQFDLHTQELELLVSLAELGQTSIWSMTIKDNNLFLGTYPSPKVFKFDLALKTLTDLNISSGKPENKFVRSLVASSSKLYAGLGSEAELLAFDFDTSTWEEVDLPENNDSFVHQLDVKDEKLFIGLRPSTDIFVLDLDNNDYNVCH